MEEKKLTFPEEKHLKEALAKHIVASKMSQNEVAQIVGITRQTLANMMRPKHNGKYATWVQINNKLGLGFSL